MSTHDHATVLQRIEAQEAELATLRHEVAALKGRPAERGTSRRSRRGAVLIAAFLVALLPFAALAANPFNDLVPGSVHNGNIDALYNSGITTGCVPNQQYCPTDLVTREQMATFLARTAGLGPNPPVANAKTAQTATNASQLGGVAAANYVQTNSNATLANLTVTGSIQRAYTSGTANNAAPVAFGTVNTDGSLASGTPNVTVAFNASLARYEITITGEPYYFLRYQTVATVIGDPLFASVSSVGNKLLVTLYSTSGTAARGSFNFITYKP